MQEFRNNISIQFLCNFTHAWVLLQFLWTRTICKQLIMQHIKIAGFERIANFYINLIIMYQLLCILHGSKSKLWAFWDHLEEGYYAVWVHRHKAWLNHFTWILLCCPKFISGWNPAGSLHYRMHLKDPLPQGIFRWRLKYDEKRDQNSITVHHSITVWVVILPHATQVLSSSSGSVAQWGDHYRVTIQWKL